MQYNQELGSYRRAGDDALAAQVQYNQEVGHDRGVRDDALASQMQYNWAAEGESYASSAESPGRDSLQSWTGSTPAKQVVQQDPDSPDARTIMRSLAKQCQNAVEGRSPAAGHTIPAFSPPNRPDLSRTPNSFFNPSFDADDHKS